MTQTPNQAEEYEVLRRAGRRVLRRTVRGSYVSVVVRLVGGGMAYGLTLLGDWLIVWTEEDGCVVVLRTVSADAGVREALLNVKTFSDFDELFLRYVWKPTRVTETVTDVDAALDAAEAVIWLMYWLLYDPPGP